MLRIKRSELIGSRIKFSLTLFHSFERDEKVYSFSLRKIYYNEDQECLSKHGITFHLKAAEALLELGELEELKSPFYIFQLLVNPLRDSCIAITQLIETDFGHTIILQEEEWKQVLTCIPSFIGHLTEQGFASRSVGCGESDVVDDVNVFSCSST
jgi:hypothetical protein